MRSAGWRAFGLACLAALSPAVAGSATPARVYAAASLTQALTEIATLWQRAGHPQPVLVFAGSATLARQLGAGAAADVFMSADAAWLDELTKRGRPHYHFLFWFPAGFVLPHADERGDQDCRADTALQHRREGQRSLARTALAAGSSSGRSDRSDRTRHEPANDGH